MNLSLRLHSGRTMSAASRTRRLSQTSSALIPSRLSKFQTALRHGRPDQRALVKWVYRVREYCPIGKLLPGMAYLVRRLLENTSNEGFFAGKICRERAG